MAEKETNQKEWDQFGLTLMQEKQMMIKNRLLGRRRGMSQKQWLALRQQKQQRRDRRGR